jgi:large subunit ribosomal protein L1
MAKAEAKSEKKSAVAADKVKAAREAGGKRNAELRVGLDRNKVYGIDEAVGPPWQR